MATPIAYYQSACAAATKRGGSLAVTGLLKPQHDHVLSCFRLIGPSLRLLQTKPDRAVLMSKLGAFAQFDQQG